VSTIAIVLIIAIIVGLNRPKLLTNGALIFAAVILHNLFGFALGYLFARLFGMDLAKRKAVMFETGMQNSGLGAALAAAHFSPLAAVPSALFSVWHNLSGSALATWFADRREP
jgi:BASS family bile acid:Na+ symporter